MCLFLSYFNEFEKSYAYLHKAKMPDFYDLLYEMAMAWRDWSEQRQWTWNPGFWGQSSVHLATPSKILPLKILFLLLYRSYIYFKKLFYFKLLWKYCPCCCTEVTFILRRQGFLQIAVYHSHEREEVYIIKSRWISQISAIDLHYSAVPVLLYEGEHILNFTWGWVKKSGMVMKESIQRI